jgi:flagellar hook-associated protein 2
MAGFRINTGSGIDPKMVDQLVELERQPIKAVEARKKTVNEEKKAFTELKGLISTLGTTLNGLRNKADFFKLKFTSSDPKIIDGTIDNNAPVGSYEVEVLQTAKTNKLLTQSFPDKNETPVGFGYLRIETEEGNSFDIEIDPDHCTLEEVATQINSEAKGIQALVVNTNENLEKDGEDSYRLLVTSEKSGKNANIYVDPDTTWMEFGEQVNGQNLHMKFDDVDVYNDTNKLTNLIKGMTLNVKKAAPGNKIIVKVEYDEEKTKEAVKSWIDDYNKVNAFIDKQFKFDSETGKAGILSKENSLRSMKRTLQTSLQFSLKEGKFRMLADVGISTDSKTGNLKFDDDKFKKALADDYGGVSKLFIQTESGAGIGVRLSEAVRSFQRTQSGTIPSKEREYKRVLENFDKDIESKERFALQRADSIRKRFAAVEQLLSNLNSQGQALQRMGSAQG